MRKSWLVLCLYLLLFSACSSGSNQAAGTVTPTPTVDTSANLPSPTPESLQRLMQTEQLLLLTPHPLRNLYDIAQPLNSIHLYLLRMWSVQRLCILCWSRNLISVSI